jgi:hypothetical protein
MRAACDLLEPSWFLFDLFILVAVEVLFLKINARTSVRSSSEVMGAYFALSGPYCALIDTG